MDNWFSLSLGDGMMAGSPSAEIEDAFARAFAQAGEPATMAVFTRPESEGRLYCEVIAYFSPAAKQIAMEFDAEPCEKPVRTGLNLLAGKPEAWTALFPEHP
jgi:hypothetical protein